MSDYSQEMNMNAKGASVYGGLRLKLSSATMVVLVALVALPLRSDAVTTAPLAGGRLVEVAVSGGSDTANPGTTCIKLDVGVNAACVGGYIAIPNNNSKLINGALSSKALNAPVVLYYATDSANQHCPALAFTPCTLISIIQK